LPEIKKKKKAVILATAHPAKFPAVYQHAGMEIPTSSSLEALKSREPCFYEVSFDASSVRSFILEKISGK